MKLVLGGVQFGLDYGVTNSEGQPSHKAAYEVMDYAWEIGIDCVDSAQAYGNANQIIADYHKIRQHRFRVINKVLREKTNINICVDNIRRERDALDIPSFHAVMFHYAPSIDAEVPDDFFITLKAEKLADFGGLSIDDAEHYALLKKRFDFDIIQLPLNPTCTKFMPDEFLKDLKFSGIDLHVRSAFLQGLFLASADKFPSYLKGLMPAIQTFQQNCRNFDLSFLTGCFLFLLQKPFVDKIVVGAQNISQLREIKQAYDDALNAYKANISLPWCEFAVNDYDLVHPVKWPVLKELHEQI